MISCCRSVSVATRAAAVLRSVDAFDGRSAWSNALLRLAANSSDQVCKRADCAAHRGQQAETEREHHYADHRAADCHGIREPPRLLGVGAGWPVNDDAPSPRKPKMIKSGDDVARPPAALARLSFVSA